VKQDIVIISRFTEHFKKVYDALLDYNMSISHFENTDEVKARLLKSSPAFLLLDFTIPGGDYFFKEFVYCYVRPKPFVIVSAEYPNGTARAAMLRRGADACVESPVIADEVLAVIEAAFRRERQGSWVQRGSLLPCIKYRDLEIDPLRRHVTMYGEPVALAAKEYTVLHFLATNAGKVLTKKEIYCAVWKENYDPKGTHVSDQISSLRRKLRLSNKDTDYIQTVFGVGYRFGMLVQNTALSDPVGRILTNS